MIPDPPEPPAPRRTGLLRSLGFWFAGSIALIAVGCGLLLRLGHVRGAAFLAATQGLCLVLVAFVARPLRAMLRAEPAWRLVLSWFFSVAFIAGVVLLYEGGLDRWAEVLMAVVALGSLLGAAVMHYFPDAAAPDRHDPDDD
jgi:hypothetical protein